MLAFKKKCVWNIQRDLSIDDNLLYAKLSKTNKQKIRTKGTERQPYMHPVKTYVNNLIYLNNLFLKNNFRFTKR